MSRVLLTVWPFTGHIHPNLSIATELRARGHEVAFYTGESARSAVLAAGFACFPFDRVDGAGVERIALSPEGILSTTNRLRQRELWRAWVLGTIEDQVEDIGRILDAWKPDVIVCDPTMWGPFLILSETQSVPVCVFSLIPACFVSGRRGPILGFPMPPPRGPAGRLAASVLRWISDTARRSIRAEANRLRAKFGLSPIDCSVTDFAARMPLYLVPGTPDFDYQRDDLPPSVHYVGPCLWPGRGDETLPEWTESIRTDQPWIYASEGTVHFEPRVLRAVAQGLAGEPVQVIITTGRHRDPASLELGIPRDTPNIHVHQWVPIQPLLPKLSGMVTIGGPSTLLAGLAEGIPAVIVPFYWDHPETAFRLEASGAGIHIRARDCNARNMKRAVLGLLNDPKYRRNAQRLAAGFRRQGGARRAAELIEALALRSAAAA